MADLDRPERITNITGLRAQPETPPDDTSGGAPAGARWPTAYCRLCRRPVWMLARTCVCGMTDPARDARRPYVLPATVVALATLLAMVWWGTQR
jgi:hypothetical protein